MSRESHNLNQSLDAIWRRGDRDEMSIKHIGHALAALIAFGDWKQGADYRYPIDYGEHDWTELQFKNAYRNLDEFLERKWARIVQYLEEWGRDKFLEALEESNFGFHAFSYLEASYLPYSKAVA